LNGSIALFEQLGFKRRAAESRIELALCYYRQGLFDLGRSTLLRVLREISVDDWELRSIALIRLAILERHAGRLQDALARLMEATTIVEKSGPWAAFRCHLELASTYKDLAICDNTAHYFDAAKDYYLSALHEFAAVGNHRYVGIAENNIGLLSLTIGSYEEAEAHLVRSRSLFEAFDDLVRAAQVNETLARLYIATEQFDSGQNAIALAVKTLELTDEEALLAEALTTSGLINNKLGHQTEAKKNFEAAYRVAERCGDHEGAGRAMLVMVEEMRDRLECAEKNQISNQLKKLLSQTQQSGLRARIERAVALIQN
jgi:tetratricopeptide (TPR) repeat protein